MRSFFIRNNRDLEVWILVVGIFFLFSLGPYINVGGEYIRFQGQKYPCLFLFSIKYFLFLIAYHIHLDLLQEFNWDWPYLLPVELVVFYKQTKSRNVMYGLIVSICLLITMEYKIFSPAQFLYHVQRVKYLLSMIK